MAYVEVDEICPSDYCRYDITHTSRTAAMIAIYNTGKKIIHKSRNV
jgi:hypothetical protein